MGERKKRFLFPKHLCLRRRRKEGWYRVHRWFLCNNAEYSIKQISPGKSGILIVIPSALISLLSLHLKLGPSRVAEHLKNTLSHEVTGFTAGFCSLKYIKRSLLGRESSLKTRVKMTVSHSLSGKRSVQTHPSAGRTSTYISPCASLPWSVGGKKSRSKH